MSDDTPVEFSDLLRGYAAAQERAAASTAPEPSVEVLQLAARVRRRRMMRTGTVAAAGVAAALVGGIAVYGVTRPDAIVPAPQPTETETFDPAPTPTPSDEPTEEPTQAPEDPEDVTRHALLPDVEPMTPDLWAQTDAEWLLGKYVAAKEEADGSSMESPAVLYLVGPDGATYEVPVPDVLRPPAPGMTGWQLEDWRPGDSRAVFLPPAEMTEGDGSLVDQLVVDLATGEELVRYPAHDRVVLLPGDRTLVIRPTADFTMTIAQVHDRDGYHLREIGPFTPAPYVDGWPASRGWAVDPSRTQLLLGTPDGISAFDLSNLTQLTVPQIPAPAMAPCSPLGWLEQDRLVVRCAEMQDLGGGNQGLGSYLWTANLGDGSTRRLTLPQTPEGHVIAEVWQVGDDVVVDREAYWEAGCGQEIAVVARDGSQTVVPGVDRISVMGVRGGRLVGQTYTCAGEYGAVVSVDVRTGQVAMVLPHVDGATVYFERANGLSQMSSPFGTWW